MLTEIESAQHLKALTFNDKFKLNLLSSFGWLSIASHTDTTIYLYLFYALFVNHT
jgi:hypothetical protein